METETKSESNVAATVVMCLALGVAVLALTLWLLNVIGPPAGIIGGAAAILVMLGAARHRKKTDR